MILVFQPRDDLPRYVGLMGAILEHWNEITCVYSGEISDYPHSWTVIDYSRRTRVCDWSSPISIELENEDLAIFLKLKYS